MTTNVNLEFISKIRELSESMLDLAIFWDKNEKELKSTNVSKDYPFSESLEYLALNTHQWYLALIKEYNEILQK